MGGTTKKTITVMINSMITDFLLNRNAVAGHRGHNKTDMIYSRF